MVRRTLIVALTATAVAAPVAASDPPPTDTPAQAVAAIKVLLKRSMPPCRTDWARIDVVGYPAHWKVGVRIRRSRPGTGVARWTIGSGWPVARNALARALAHRCA